MLQGHGRMCPGSKLTAVETHWPNRAYMILACTSSLLLAHLLLCPHLYESGHSGPGRFWATPGTIVPPDCCTASSSAWNLLPSGSARLTPSRICPKVTFSGRLFPTSLQIVILTTPHLSILLCLSPEHLLPSNLV
uniref:Uncharacterized protein n=1 Tax=Myotis myotis TaxID=51298 RepID=A0A7J7XZL1_MYOMY|nr:hypothetical protein mMyoMyo1_011321 [Myotis myotis]